jgi:peptidoglycan/LPS O-acetylase OafA/YrhL
MPARAGDVPHLTGLRGYASLGVFIVHAAIMLFPTAPSWLLAITGVGQNGVIVFFVLSAYTIALSLEGRRFDWIDYAMKRIFRIVPAYYFVLTIALLVGYHTHTDYSAPFDFSSYLLHVAFLNNFSLAHAHNALGVEWTLSIEMGFYIVLPAIVWLSRSLPGALILAGVSAVGLALPHMGPAWSAEAIQYWRWSPAPYFVCFAIGVLAFTHRHTIATLLGRRISWLVPLGLAMLLFIPPSPHEVRVPYYTLVSLMFVIGGASKLGTAIFSNRWILPIGLASYSLYLWHFPLLDIVHFMGALGLVLAIAVAALLATFTYQQVEQRGRRWGRALLQQRRPLVPATELPRS